MTTSVPVGIETLFGIAVLVAMTAIAAGLTWVSLQGEGPAALQSGGDAETAD